VKEGRKEGRKEDTYSVGSLRKRDPMEYVSSFLHLRMEIGPVSETCFL
jgi:hypothetical protein